MPSSRETRKGGTQPQEERNGDEEDTTDAHGDTGGADAL
jgi:hypothetical protein